MKLLEKIGNNQVITFVLFILCCIALVWFYINLDYLIFFNILGEVLAYFLILFFISYILKKTKKLQFLGSINFRFLYFLIPLIFIFSNYFSLIDQYKTSMHNSLNIIEGKGVDKNFDKVLLENNSVAVNKENSTLKQLNAINMILLKIIEKHKGKINKLNQEENKIGYQLFPLLNVEKILNKEEILLVEKYINEYKQNILQRRVLIDDYYYEFKNQLTYYNYNYDMEITIESIKGLERGVDKYNKLLDIKIEYLNTWLTLIKFLEIHRSDIEIKKDFIYFKTEKYEQLYKSYVNKINYLVNEEDKFFDDQDKRRKNLRNFIDNINLR